MLQFTKLWALELMEDEDVGQSPLCLHCVTKLCGPS